jgi:hypothetical protein
MEMAMGFNWISKESRSWFESSPGGLGLQSVKIVSVLFSRLPWQRQMDGSTHTHSFYIETPKLNSLPCQSSSPQYNL